MNEIEELTERVTLLEQKLEATIKALHLTTVAAKPASEWLDATLSKMLPTVCTDPDCTTPRRPGRPMHGPHDFRAGVKA